MLMQQDLDHFPVRAAGLAYFGEEIDLFQELVVVLAEVAKELRALFERYGVDVVIAPLQALRQLGVNVEDPPQNAVLDHQFLSWRNFLPAVLRLTFEPCGIGSNGLSRIAPDGESTCGEPCHNRHRTSAAQSF